MRYHSLSALALAAALVAPVVAYADDAAPAPSHGGRLVFVGDKAAAFEVVHDSSIGSVTVFARPQAGKPLSITDEPVLVVTANDGSHALTLARVAGTTDSWKATDASLKTPSLEGTLKVRLGSEDLSGSLSASEEPVPAIPARNETRVEPSHGGHMVMIADRPFEWAHDAQAGSLTLYLAPATDAKAAPAVTEAIAILTGDAGAKELTLVAVAGTPNTWKIEDPALKTAMLEGTLRVTIDGKPVEAALLPRGEHGGRILRLGVDAPFVEWKHDAKEGTATLYLIVQKSETYADSSATLAQSPVFDLAGAAGTKSITFTRVEGQANAWTAKDELLKGRDWKGTLRVKIGDKDFTAAVEPHKKGMKKEKGSSK